MFSEIVPCSFICVVPGTLATAKASPSVKTILEQNGSGEMDEYLEARGVTSVGGLARMVGSPDLLESKVLAQYVTGWEDPRTKKIYKSNG